MPQLHWRSCGALHCTHIICCTHDMCGCCACVQSNFCQHVRHCSRLSKSLIQLLCAVVTAPPLLLHMPIPGIVCRIGIHLAWPLGSQMFSMCMIHVTTYTCTHKHPRSFHSVNILTEKLHQEVRNCVLLASRTAMHPTRTDP